MGTYGVDECGEGGVWDADCILRGDREEFVVEVYTVELNLPATLNGVRDLCTRDRSHTHRGYTSFGAKDGGESPPTLASYKRTGTQVRLELSTPSGR